MIMYIAHLSSWEFDDGDLLFSHDLFQEKVDSAFVFRCLDSIIPLVSISEISRLQLASEAEQAV